MVVERMGKFHSVQKAGFFFLIPFVDRVAYVVDMREKALEIMPQAAITKDNVSLQVSGNVYAEFSEAKTAA